MSYYKADPAEVVFSMLNWLIKEVLTAETLKEAQESAETAADEMKARHFNRD